VLIVAAFAAATIAVRRGRVGTASAVPTLAAAALAGAVLGGWWYLRNVLATGNPLYPFTVRLGDTTLFPGRLDVQEALVAPPRARPGRSLWRAAGRTMSNFSIKGTCG
jgi:hypothetical protein